MILKSMVIALLLFMTTLAAAEELPDRSSTAIDVNLNKEQLGALAAAIRHMQRLRRTYKGQQVLISDKGATFHVTFMEDPIDIRIVGAANASSWEVRKSDFKVMRELLVR